MSWFRRFAPRGRAVLRVFAFPHAGAGAAAFAPLVPELPAGVELCAVSLPGREQRLREPPLRRFEPILRALEAEIDPLLDLPYVLFGHSVGAVAMFELARRLRVKRPRMLLVSGRQAPHLAERRQPVHHLGDDALLAELRSYAGTEERVLADPELLSLILPALRADLELAETYGYREERPLDIPILAYGGTADPDVTLEELAAWKRHTTGKTRVSIFSGEHFFIYRSSEARRALSRELAAIASATASSSSDST